MMMVMTVMMMVMMVNLRCMMMVMMSNLCRMRIQVMATHMTAEMKEDATESSEKSDIWI